MCGLCGVAGNIQTVDVANFKTLLYVSLPRGKDSTGVAAISTKRGVRNERVEIVKEAVPSYRFIEIENTKRYSTVFDRFDIDLLIGHVRWATVGKVDRFNAHPFSTEKFIGAHNGTLLNPEFRGKSKTDSELMFEKMDEEGVIDTLEDLSSKSAYAVTIWEKGTRKVWFARNNERSLWVGIHNKRDVIYWASERRFLDFLEQDMEIAYFPAYKVFVMDLNEIKAGYMTPWEVFDLSDKSKEKDPYDKQDDYGAAYGWGSMWDDYYVNNPNWSQEPNPKDKVKTVYRSKSPNRKESRFDPDEWEDWDEDAGDWAQFMDDNRYDPDVTRANAPFDVECAACDNIISPEDVERSKVWYEGVMIYICDTCKGVCKDVNIEIQDVNEAEIETH